MVIDLRHVSNQTDERESEGDRTADRKTEPITVWSEREQQERQSGIHRDEEGRCICRSLMVFKVQQHEREDEHHRIREGADCRHLEDVANLRRESK